LPPFWRRSGSHQSGCAAGRHTLVALVTRAGSTGGSVAVGHRIAAIGDDITGSAEHLAGLIQSPPVSSHRISGGAEGRGTGYPINDAIAISKQIRASGLPN
jgi:hypothetical protein